MTVPNLKTLLRDIPPGAAGIGFAIDVALSVLLIGLPSILMGATIPVLTQAPAALQVENGGAVLEIDEERKIGNSAIIVSITSEDLESTSGKSGLVKGLG